MPRSKNRHTRRAAKKRKAARQKQAAANRKVCAGKVRYSDEAAAVRASTRLDLYAYRCHSGCGGWHLTSTPPS